MANDERNGDDLFEDLDKFFAPIKDVEWDEPEGQASVTPQEEHVSVRPTEPTAPEVVTPDPPAAEPYTEPAPPAPYAEVTPPDDAGSLAASDEDDEDDEAQAAWYDTGVLEPIEVDPLGNLDDDDDVTTVRIPDGDPAGLDEPVHDEAQGDLFEAPTWSIDDDDDDEALAEVAPAHETPSEEDLEAAAAHFAGSLRSEEQRYDTAPIGSEGQPFDSGDLEVQPEAGGDLLSDLGAEEVEDDILSDLEPDEPQRTVVVGGGEGFGGPSWQEPSAVEVGADLERRGPNVGERDVPAAFMTGLVLAGIAVASLLVGEAVFAVVAALAVLGAQGELFGVMTKHHLQPATFVGLVTGQLMLWGAYFRGEEAIPAMFALGLVATFLWFMTVPSAHRKNVMQQIGVTVLNVAWIPLLAAYLVVMLALPDGRELVIAVIALTFVYDTAAFFVGSVWGGSFFTRPLAASISPKKSLEGLIGGGLVVVVVSVAMVPTGFIAQLDGSRVEALLLGLVIAVAATLGDLAESLIKRDIGIKDMGSVLPGHGGVLDRIDSLLFVAPAAYLLFRVVFVA